jgi:hypothetical protein
MAANRRLGHQLLAMIRMQLKGLNRPNPAALLLVLISCSRGSSRISVPQSGTHSVSATSSGVAKSSGKVLAELIDSLSRLGGTFDRGGLGHWEFSGDQQLFGQIAAFSDSAVVRLVQCLDDTLPARARADNRPVPRGFMCYTALERTAYYEWDPREYHNATNHRWPGVLEPSAHPAELRAARAAWAEVVAKKQYSLE